MHHKLFLGESRAPPTRAGKPAEPADPDPAPRDNKTETPRRWKMNNSCGSANAVTLCAPPHAHSMFALSVSIKHLPEPQNEN